MITSKWKAVSTSAVLAPAYTARPMPHSLQVTAPALHSNTKVHSTNLGLETTFTLQFQKMNISPLSTQYLFQILYLGERTLYKPAHGTVGKSARNRWECCNVTHTMRCCPEYSCTSPREMLTIFWTKTFSQSEKGKVWFSLTPFGVRVESVRKTD